MGGKHHHHHHKKKKSTGDVKTDIGILTDSAAESDVRITIDSSPFLDTSIHQIRIQKDYVDVKDDVTNSQTTLSGLANPEVILEPDLNLLKLWVRFDDGKLENMEDSSGFANAISANAITGTTNAGRWDYSDSSAQDVQDFFLFPGKAANIINYYSSAFAFDVPFFRTANVTLTVTTNTNIQLDATTGYSVSFWLYFNTITAGGLKQVIGYKADGTSDWYQFFIAAGTDKVEFHISEAGAVVKRRYDTALVTGQWYHVVGTYNASTNASEIYVNGSAGVSSTTTTALTFGGATNLIFNFSNTATPTTGWYMDDLRYYKPKVLSSAEVTQLYNYGTITAGVTNPFIAGISYISS